MRTLRGDHFVSANPSGKKARPVAKPAVIDENDGMRLSVLSTCLELTKAKITSAVTLSVATGYFLFLEHFSLQVIAPAAGVFLLACGSAALNQVQEAKIDRRMERTRRRPIPSGRVGRDWALFIALALIGAGFYVLAGVGTHTLALLGLAAFAVLWYNGVYVLLKRVTAFAAVPGALVGAVPPVIGWTAAGGVPDDPAILEVAFFFFLWQIPHFWLLLLMYGEDFEAAGLPSLMRRFSRPQIARITSMWLMAAAVAGMLVSLRSRMGLIEKAVVLAGALWLAHGALRILLSRSGLDRKVCLPAFIRINLFAFLVMVCLILGALLK